MSSSISVFTSTSAKLGTHYANSAVLTSRESNVIWLLQCMPGTRLMLSSFKRCSRSLESFSLNETLQTSARLLRRKVRIVSREKKKFSSRPPWLQGFPQCEREKATIFTIMMKIIENSRSVPTKIQEIRIIFKKEETLKNIFMNKISGTKIRLRTNWKKV